MVPSGGERGTPSVACHPSVAARPEIYLGENLPKQHGHIDAVTRQLGMTQKLLVRGLLSCLQREAQRPIDDLLNREMAYVCRELQLHD